MKSVVLGIFILSSLACPLAAQELNGEFDAMIARKLSGAEIREAFEDKTHEGVYQFPDYHYGEDGHYTEYHHPDGTSDYKEYELGVIKGRWRIEDDAICYGYQDSRINGACFQMYLQGTCYYQFTSQKSEDGSWHQSVYWNARSVIDGTIANCNPMVG